MNKTVVFVTFACLAALGLAGAVLLQLNRPDATATFTGFVVNILGIVTLAAGTFYGLGQVQKKVDTVQKQTNGTLSRLMEDKESLTDTNRRLAEENTALKARLANKPKKAGAHVGRDT